MPVTDIDSDPWGSDIEEERPGRELDNSRLLTALVMWFHPRQEQLGVEVFMCQDIQVSAARRCTVDLCVTVGMPDEQVFTAPPVLCIQILSRFEPIATTLRRIADYLSFGVPYVWLIDPTRRTAIVYTATGFILPEDGILRTQNPDIALPLAELFELF
jgi:Uma2 family endonuclease